MKKNRVLFITNLSHNSDSLKSLSMQSTKNITEIFGSSNLPLGILSIDSYIKKMCPNTETEIIDLNTEFLKRITGHELDQQLMNIINNFDEFLLEDIRKTIESFDPNIIAISSLFDKSVPTLLKLSKKIKMLKNDILLIAGGHPANNLYRQILMDENNAIDGISLGEGEIPFSELLNSDNQIAYLKESPYFATKEKCLSGEDIHLKTIAVQDLDDIPLYDYDSFFNKYGDDILYFHNNVLDSKHSFNKQAVIMTSRGCPYNCIFCASKSVHAQKVRKHSVERIKEEIDYWIDRHHVDTIGFIDDHILFDIERAIEICEYTGSKGIDFRFPNGLAIAPINKDLVDAFVRNNVKEVQLALESGSKRVLSEIIKKPLSLKRAEEVFNLFLDTDIFVKVFLVVGFPDETKQDIDDSLQFLRRANFHWASISTPSPISGSRLLEESLEKGYIKDYNYGDISFFNNIYENSDVSTQMNNNIRYTVNLDINFIHNPYMRMGKYELAKERFESILKNYPDHAFAHYYLYKCLKELHADSKVLEQVKTNYNRIIDRDIQWRKYAEYFSLELVI